MIDNGLQIVPGFTAEQSLGLRAVARQTAEAMGEQLASRRDVEELRDTIYGNGSPGMKTVLTELKKDMSSLIWWYRALVVAVISSWIAMLVSFLR